MTQIDQMYKKLCVKEKEVCRDENDPFLEEEKNPRILELRGAQ